MKWAVILGCSGFRRLGSGAEARLLNTKDLNQLCVRAGQLMEAGGVVIAGIAAGCGAGD